MRLDIRIRRKTKTGKQDKAGRFERTGWPPCGSDDEESKFEDSRVLIAWRQKAQAASGGQCLNRDPCRLDREDESEGLQATLIGASDSLLPGVVTNTTTSMSGLPSFERHSGLIQTSHSVDGTIKGKRIEKDR